MAPTFSYFLFNLFFIMAVSFHDYIYFIILTGEYNYY